MSRDRGQDVVETGEGKGYGIGKNKGVRKLCRRNGRGREGKRRRWGDHVGALLHPDLLLRQILP